MNWLKMKIWNWYEIQRRIITHIGFDYWFKIMVIRPIFNISYIRAFLSYLCWKSPLIQKFCHWLWVAECIECEKDLSWERDCYLGEWFETHCKSCSFYFLHHVFCKKPEDWLKDLKIRKTNRSEMHPRAVIDLPGGNF